MNQHLSSSSSTDSILGYHNVYYNNNNIHDSNQNSVVELPLSPTVVVGSGSRSVRSIQEKDRASTVPSKSKGKFSRFFSFSSSSSSSSLNSSNSSTSSSSSSTLLSPTSTTNSSISSDSLIFSSLSCYKCCSDYTMSYYSPAYRTNPIPSSNTTTTTTTTTNNNNSNGDNNFFSSSSSSPSSNTSSNNNNNNNTSQQYRYQYSQSKAERILRNYRAKKTCLTMNEVSLMFVKEYYDTCNENSKHENNNNDCCSICLSDFNPKDIVYNLPCTHTYHSACLDPWFLSTAATCPLCNRNYKTEADKLRSMFNEMVTISQTKKKFNYI